MQKAEMRTAGTRKWCSGPCILTAGFFMRVKAIPRGLLEPLVTAEAFCHVACRQGMACVAHEMAFNACGLCGENAAAKNTGKLTRPV